MCGKVYTSSILAMRGASWLDLKFFSEATACFTFEARWKCFKVCVGIKPQIKTTEKLTESFVLWNWGSMGFIVQDGQML